VIQSDGKQWHEVSDANVALTSADISDFTEAAQDAVGAMAGTFLEYVDGTPALNVLAPLEWNCGQGGNLIAASTTSYMGVKAQVADDSLTENTRQTIAARGASITKLLVYIRTAQPASGSLVITFRINGADTALVVTIAAGSAAGLYTATHAGITVAANDLLSHKLANNATGNSAALMDITVMGKYTS
jgi:hypothetical protein